MNPNPDLRPSICLIVSTYARGNGDASVPWLRERIKHLRQRGYTITVLAPSFEGLKTHEIDGVEVLRVRYFFRRWEHLTHDQGAPNRIRNR